MVGMRDTPRDIQDAMRSAGGMNASDAYDPENLTADKARILGRECYQASTNWLNVGKRQKWTDNLRAFQGLHPTGSKYLSGDYRYRSRLFKPKTRTMVRKGEAETAAAFFSNEDVINISAQDDNDPMQLASAEINKELVQYRLTKTIPWFLTLVGARQDCDTMGICIGKAYWKYSERFVRSENRPILDPMTGMPSFDPVTGLPSADAVDIFQKLDDHPWVDLIPVENFRFDPAADWRNPIATSPYLIELIPMYLADVRAKIRKGEWLDVADSALLGANDIDDDTTRRAREEGRIPGKDKDVGKPRDFDIVWVRENIMRWGGRDWQYLTLQGAGELLSLPTPIEEIYLQGIRPYVCGFVVPEAHKTYPAGKVEIVRDLQTQSNDMTNLRLDNVKLAINPRQFVAEGKGIDPNDVRIFNPGKVVMVKDPRNDVVWDRPPDVTMSSYQEQESLNIDIDELAGGVSQASMQANPQLYRTTGNMEMLDQNSNKMGEYEQRVFAETFVEPIVRQIVLLEQKCESDEVILALAGKKAQLYQKFGINQITDQLLQQELTTKVNVGIGATNPKLKLANFLTAADALGKMFGPAAAQGANFEEVSKEVFGLCGYKDGSRFFKPGFDPSQAQQGAVDPLQKIQEMKHEENMLSLQHKKEQAQIDNDLKQKQMQQQLQMDQYQAYMKAMNDRYLGMQELAQKKQLAIAEMITKERIAQVQAKGKLMGQSLQAHSQLHGQMLQQKDPVTGEQDQELSRFYEEGPDPVQELMTQITNAFTQSIGMLSEALTQQTVQLDRQNRTLERANEIALAPRVPKRGKNGLIEYGQVELPKEGIL